MQHEWGYVYNILLGKPEGMKPLNGSRHRWKDNFRMDLKEREWEAVGWIHLAQDRHWQ
jgi:hypothetical protein